MNCDVRLNDSAGKGFYFPSRCSPALPPGEGRRTASEGIRFRLYSFRICNRIVCLVSMIGIGLLTTACAALPEVRYLSSSLAAPANPTVTNAQGTLSAKKSKSLLASRWRNSHVDVAALAALEEAATGSPLIAGNKVTLLYDGPQTMAAMIAAISAATDHINLETYIFDQDELGIRFADLLIARQRAGVQVNVIYDSVGTIGTPQPFFDKMRDAGIHLLAFNPVPGPANNPPTSLTVIFFRR